MLVSIWVTAIVLYILFRLWYDGFSKPLSVEEIEQYLKALEQRSSGDFSTQNVEVLRKFMEKDDGKEFLMANILQFNDSPVIHPDSGNEVAANQLLQQDYFRPFMARLIKHAGHPVLSSRVVGGYLDALNTPANPGWHAVGYVRYRSRRDFLVDTIGDPTFFAIHKYKIAALKQTLALPTHTLLSLYISPRASIAMILLIIALVAQILLV